MRNFRRNIFIAALCSATVLAGPLAHADQQIAAASPDAVLETATPTHAADDHFWELSSGFDSSRGTYGVAQATTVSYVPVSFAYHAGSWTVSVDGGFLNVKGPLNYVDISNLIGDDPFAPPSGHTSTRGAADTTLGLKYALFEDFDNGRFIDIGGRVRVPTASRSKGLGTGHTGGDLQLDVTQVLGPWSVFASGGYGVRDSRDADRNPWSASAGIGRTLAENLSAGTFYQWRQSARAGSGAAHEVFAYASYRFSQHFSLMIYGATGFSPESVNREIGVRYTYRWP